MLRPRPLILSFIVVLVIFFILSLAGYADADRMEAEEMSFREGIFTLRGSVYFERDGISMRADLAGYNEKNSELHLNGNISYEDEDIVLKGDEALFNLENKTGWALNAEIFVKGDGYFIRAERVEKTGETEYSLRKAQFTTCDSPEPAWSIRGSRARMVLGGAIKATNVTFYIKDTVPVFYFPYMLAPILVERQTGLLGPNIGHREFSGVNVQLPFYWAMAENRDATFTLDYHTKRAIGLEVQGRFVEFGGYQGDMSVGYLRDWKDNRNYLTLEGSARAPFGYVDADLANYPDYYRLYSTAIQDRARRFLETKGEAVLKNFEGGRAYLVTRFSVDTAPGVGQDTVLQRLPEVGFFIDPARRGPFLFTADASLANFYRESGQWGQRLRVAPKLSHFVGHSLNLFQSVGLEGRGYSLSGPDENISRAVFSYEGSLRGRLRKPYGHTTHFLEPTLAFFYRSLSGSDPPVVFDSLEPEKNTALIEASVLNRFFRNGGEFMLFKATSRYDMKAERPFRPLEFNLYMVQPASIRAALTYDPNTTNIDRADLETGFSPGRDLSIRMRESYSRVDDTWTHSLGFTATPFNRVTWEGDVWYDSKGAGLRDMKTTIRYLSQCWGIRFIVSKRPEDFSFYVQLELPGLTKLGPS